MSKIVKVEPVVTMSSREMAELTGVRHDNVKRTIETLATTTYNDDGSIKREAIIQLPQIEEVKNHLGQVVQEYRLGKRDSYVIVAQLSPEFTGRLVDRWQELEALQAAPAIQAPIEAGKTFKSMFGIARLIGLDKNVAAISANQATQKLSGVNLLELLGQTQLENPEQAQYFTPTELGKTIGISGRAFNLLLAEAGMQARRGDEWEVLPAANEFCRILDTGKRHGSGVMIQQIKWASSVIPLLKTTQTEL